MELLSGIELPMKLQEQYLDVKMEEIVTSKISAEDQKYTFQFL